ncbi:hypothetical protein [Mycobacterium servetii]|uniref:Transposase n=1 Tax=Mycobacterium servetii TaxID=3237418 RepID=A0ABV4C8M3_9MYCO
MIGEHLPDLEAATSTKRACELLGASRATLHRHRNPPPRPARRVRPEPLNKLTEAERQQILTVLRSEQYCDLAPAQVWARLLDDGVYLCSIRTMYRLLAIAGENRERRRQRTHPGVSFHLCKSGVVHHRTAVGRTEGVFCDQDHADAG